MEDIYEILKYTIPSVIVFAAVFFVLKKFMDSEYRKQVFELKKSNLNTITPIRLQAYERATLFLERINMENLVKRVTKANMKADQLQLALITSIRFEYEHNLSQQLYMSEDAWNAVKNAREETVKLIHMAMAQIGGKGSAMDLTKAIFTLMEEEKNLPYQKAISILKREVKQIF